MERWCLSSFVRKAKNCHTIDFKRLLCDQENVKVLMGVAEEIICLSECLQRLVLDSTNCQQEQADSIFTAILQMEVTSLTHLDISGHKRNFYGPSTFFQSQETVELLCKVIKAQTNLIFFRFVDNEIEHDFQQQIIDAIRTLRCQNVIMTDEEDAQYKTRLQREESLRQRQSRTNRPNRECAIQ